MGKRLTEADITDQLILPAPAEEGYGEGDVLPGDSVSLTRFVKVEEAKRSRKKVQKTEEDFPLVLLSFWDTRNTLMSITVPDSDLYSILNNVRLASFARRIPQFDHISDEELYNSATSFLYEHTVPKHKEHLSKFSTYFCRSFYYFLVDYCRRQKTVVLPKREFLRKKVLINLEADFIEKNSRQPTWEELTDLYNQYQLSRLSKKEVKKADRLTVNQTKTLMSVPTKAVSIHTDVYKSENSPELIDRLVDKEANAFNSIDLIEIVQDALSKLQASNDDLYQVVCMMTGYINGEYYEPMTSDQVGKYFGVTGSAIRLRYKTAKKILQDYLMQSLEEYTVVKEFQKRQNQ